MSATTETLSHLSWRLSRAEVRRLKDEAREAARESRAAAQRVDAVDPEIAQLVEAMARAAGRAIERLR